jgi:hypothetical protein
MLHDDNDLQRQQALPALQTLRALRPAHELAQGLGEKLGTGALLL